MKQYSNDPAMISLEEFRKLTAGRNMLPGRVSLQEDMEERFDVLKGSGIENLEDLFRLLGSKPKIDNFSSQTGLSADYLVLLKREAGSYLARPFPLSNFPGIPYEYVEILKSRGIKNTKDLFEQVQIGYSSSMQNSGYPPFFLFDLLYGALQRCCISYITMRINIVDAVTLKPLEIARQFIFCVARFRQ